ncbi:putative GNAT family N-acetyltransferase [Microthyrium microscopicum]|uniref:Putative GNAT family N-acetyltransferase n=1 Tax=Microthyrium microscopicum TaxID=703497 RepID=A0A6A6UGW5_9PEZI|nr:putative GNAT family N-acetyltransferase [Microthyrium microscopicum]
MEAPLNWRKDSFLVSTNHSNLEPDAINKALGSDVIWWAESLSGNQLRTMLQNSLCFGLYKILEAPDGQDQMLQIGLARLITDYVTFCYLTDVYVLDEYQGKGLGSFLMECVNEYSNSLPSLRGLMLVTSSEQAQKWYMKLLGAKELETRAGHPVKALLKERES